jgi:ribosomal protein S18 acetylase RimI-like enzyme
MSSGPTDDKLERNARDLRIIRGNADHLDEIEQLWRQLAADTIEIGAAIGPPLGSDESWRRARVFHRQRLDQPGSFLLLAYRGTQVIGYALVAISSRPSLTWELDDRRAELDFICVRPEERCSGVGVSLVAAAKDALRSMDIHRLTLNVLATNARGRKFHTSNGFVTEQLVMAARF